MNSAQKVLRLGKQLLKIAFTNPARLSHVFGTGLAAADEVATRDLDLLRFHHASVNDLLPSGEEPLRVELALFPKSHASISVLEFSCLILLMHQARAKRVFEFGTFKGISITQLALNLPADAQIYTLDLPDESLATALSIADPEDAAIAREAGKGSLVPAALRPRIQFLQQDSATFDEKPFAGTMDFIFVDGAHNYDYVKNDSEKGWRMLRSGGIIAWHDCRIQDPGVVRYLLESSFKPTLIHGTTVAYAVKP
jgi:predicted O-methyltransferase YrrM